MDGRILGNYLRWIYLITKCWLFSPNLFGFFMSEICKNNPINNYDLSESHSDIPNVDTFCVHLPPYIDSFYVRLSPYQK